MVGIYCECSSNDYDMSKVTVLDKDKTNLEYVKKYGVKTVLVDLAEKKDWYKEFTGNDIVIKLETQISSQEYEPFHRDNVLATKNIIEATKKAGIKKIIHFSSAAVLSVRKDDYAKTKLAGEKLIKKSNLAYCILQPSLMYGPTDDKNIGFLIDFDVTVLYTTVYYWLLYRLKFNLDLSKCVYLPI